MQPRHAVDNPHDGRVDRLHAQHANGLQPLVGWPIPEARAFLRDLTEHATQRRFVYAHRWKPHDLVMWDNRTTMHRVRRFDDLHIVRDVRRTTTRAEGPTAEQEAA